MSENSWAEGIKQRFETEKEMRTKFHQAMQTVSAELQSVGVHALVESEIHFDPPTWKITTSDHAYQINMAKLAERKSAMQTDDHAAVIRKWLEEVIVNYE